MAAESRETGRAVVPHGELKVVGLPGIEHRTLADAAHGLQQLSVWRQTLAPGAGTPSHRHAAEEVVICHSGWGALYMQDRIHDFGPDCSVLIPSDVLHKIVNLGHVAMEITAVLAAPSVDVLDAGGRRIELPW